jgi:hypothetical protein
MAFLDNGVSSASVTAAEPSEISGAFKLALVGSFIIVRWLAATRRTRI